MNLWENPGLATQLADRAFEDVQNYTWDKRAERILQFSGERLKEVDENIRYLRKNLIQYLQKNILVLNFNDFNNFDG